ncbi:hypothetical protein LINPERPRIM_LOCUS596, partial [Linum perenne]
MNPLSLIPFCGSQIMSFLSTLRKPTASKNDQPYVVLVKSSVLASLLVLELVEPFWLIFVSSASSPLYLVSS